MPVGKFANNCKIKYLDIADDSSRNILYTPSTPDENQFIKFSYAYLCSFNKIDNRVGLLDTGANSTNIGARTLNNLCATTGVRFQKISSDGTIYFYAGGHSSECTSRVQLRLYMFNKIILSFGTIN